MIGTILSVTRNDGTATGRVLVAEPAPRGLTEYTATVSAVDSAGQPLTAAQIKAALVAAWQAQRPATPGAPTDLSGLISGTVNL